MTFYKSFPQQKVEGSYTSWIEIGLTPDEEQDAENSARDEHIRLFQECVDDAKEILLKAGMKQFDPNIIAVANALFEKRASHVIYHKEDYARAKFDQQSSTKTTRTQSARSEQTRFRTPARP